MGFRMGEEPKTCRRACVFIELFIVDTFLHSSTGTVLPTNVASSPSAILPAIITTFTTTTTCYCTSVLCTWRYASIVCTADDTCIVRTCLDPSSLVFLVLLSVLVVVPQSSSSGSVRSFDGPCRVFDRSCFYSIILFDLKFTIFSSFFIGSEEDYFDAFFPISVCDCQTMFIFSWGKSRTFWGWDSFRLDPCAIFTHSGLRH